ncbi:hypothetical protein [Candidatus Sulfurimonas baltica]|uniref:Uncharacterized protein n=1 Tax=Candidatus Sulfurimonas baltica TaxID=2740404 RepID=A0A7S7LXC8_9BACT|nr:hypothetical protein [Candidatus Sulfurimonas baltica]QOY53140.1 hypothetical protein HUE88_05530 [Candidatus Sulfurimonas baltica]
MNSYLKIIAGMLATIILGAIGSGFWERILSPGFDKLQYFVVNKISFFYTGYLDSIYEDASTSLIKYNDSSSILITQLSHIKPNSF